MKDTYYTINRHKILEYLLKENLTNEKIASILEKSQSTIYTTILLMKEAKLIEVYKIEPNNIKVYTITKYGKITYNKNKNRFNGKIPSKKEDLKKKLIKFINVFEEINKLILQSNDNKLQVKYRKIIKSLNIKD